MDPERFAETCRRVVAGEALSGGIGALGEKSLHLAVKCYFQPDPGKREVPVGPYVADAWTAEGIVEVQTRSFQRLRPKLQAFLSQGPVTLVYPVPAQKTVSWISEDGTVSPPRKSPAKPQAGHVLGELYQLRTFLTPENFRLCVLLLQVAEYRLLNGWSKNRKRGSTRYDRIPLALLDEVWVRSPREYAQLIPPELPEPFTSRELGKAVGLSPKKGSCAANTLWSVGAVERVGKRGNAYLYQKKTL